MGERRLTNLYNVISEHWNVGCYAGGKIKQRVHWGLTDSVTIGESLLNKKGLREDEG